MRKYIIRRLLLIIPMLFGITVISYLIMNLAPGDAAAMYVDPERMNEDPQAIEKVREMLGLNDPVYIRYFKWLREALKGNFGYSYLSKQPVLQEIKARIGPTVMLSLLTMVIEVTVGIGLGVYSARHQYKFSDYALSLFAFAGMSVPAFWYAMVMILLFTLTLGWLPSMGLTTPGLSGPWYVMAIDRAKHLIMPVAAMSLRGIGSWMRYQRSSYLEVMNQDYMRTARSKGLDERTITWTHAFKNASIPIVTMIGGTLPGLIGGTFVIESVFGLPGLGRFGTQSIMGRDYPSVMAVTFFTSILVMVGVFISDILYAIVDPRIKYS